MDQQPLVSSALLSLRSALVYFCMLHAFVSLALRSDAQVVSNAASK